MYVANCSLKYNPEDFTVVDRVLTLAGNTELVGDAFIAHHCGGLLLDGGVFDEKKVGGKYVVTLVGETPTAYMKAKCSLLCDSAKFEIVEGALSLKAVEPSGFDITWDGDTEGRESVADVYYKVSDSAPSISNSFISFSYNGVEISILEENITEVTEHAIFIGDGESDYILIAEEDTALDDTEIAKGVYFVKTPNGFVSSLTYVTQD